MTTIECGTSHKDAKDTDKYATTTKKQTNDGTTDKYFSKHCEDNTKNESVTKCKQIIQGPYNKQ
jgi:hypothetical protein